jgi:hypothetical protein
MILVALNVALVNFCVGGLGGSGSTTIVFNVSCAFE